MSGSSGECSGAVCCRGMCCWGVRQEGACAVGGGCCEGFCGGRLSWSLMENGPIGCLTGGVCYGCEGSRLVTEGSAALCSRNHALGGDVPWGIRCAGILWGWAVRV